MADNADSKQTSVVVLLALCGIVMLRCTADAAVSGASWALLAGIALLVGRRRRRA